MNKVYSFRLDAENPREAQVKKIIQIWISNGYSLRHLVTDALLSLENQSDDSYEMRSVFDKLVTLLEELNKQERKIRHPLENINDTYLSPKFLNTVKKEYKQGIKSRI